MTNNESATFNRYKALELLELLKNGRSFLLFGPRQTGKSTIVEGLFAQLAPARCLKYFLQLPSHRGRLEEDPELIVREVEAYARHEPVYVAIDEIQKVPALMDPLQYLLDKKRIILAATGSSARKLRHLGTNWLPGRIHLHHLPPLTWRETSWPVSRHEECLRFGTLPGVLATSDLSVREAGLASYAHLYLEEEIRLEAAVRNVPRFAKFLRLAALESGSAPNLSKIGARVELTHPTIREYFQILEDSLITHRLPAFGHRRDAVLRTPKYYFFDLGVRNAAAGIGHSEGILTLQRGPLFEHWVILEAIAHGGRQLQLSYWRSKQGEEVDLVIEKGTKRIAVEIKATSKPTKEDTDGLVAFARKYTSDAHFLVCQAERACQLDHCLAIPWTELMERIEAV